MSGKTVLKKTEFKTRTIYTVNHYDVSEEQFTQLVGNDTMTERLESQIQATTAASVFSDLETVVPPETMEQKVDETHSRLFGGEKLGSMAKGKRAKSAAQKVALQQHLLSEQKALAQRRRTDRQLQKENFSMTYVKEESVGRYTPEELEAVQDWMIRPMNESGTEQLNEGMFEEKYFAQNFYRGVLKETNNMDPNEFAYNSDAQFVSEFAKKYGEICKAAGAEVFLNKFKANLDSEINGMALAKVTAKIQMFKALKAEYEDRMKLINSPYYTLLAQKDLKGIRDDGSDPKLTEYLALVQKLSQSKVGKKADLGAVYEEKYRESCRSQAAEDAERFPKYLEKVDQEELENADTPDEAVQKYYKQKKEALKSGYPEDNTDFLLNVPPVFRGTLTYGMGLGELTQVEAKMAKILRDGKIDSQQIAPEHLETIKAQIMHYADIRREYMSSILAERDAVQVSTGSGCDLDNPEFKKNPKYPLLLKLSKGENGREIATKEAQDYKEKYFQELVDIFKNISIMGYTISEEYEPRITTQADEALEHARDLYERKIKQERFMDPNDTTRIEFPTFKLNGEVFHTYHLSDLHEMMAGNEYQIEGAEGQEIMELMHRYDADLKEMAIVTALFNGEGGEKALVNTALNLKLTERINSYMKSINDILRNHVRGYDNFLKAQGL